MTTEKRSSLVQTISIPAIIAVVGLTLSIARGHAQEKPESPLPANPPATNAKPPETVKIRILAKEPDWLVINEHAEQYRKQHPHVGFEYVDARHDVRSAAEMLLAGDIDIATLPGPLLEPGAKTDWLRPHLEKSGSQVSVIGWQTLAVVVHPSNPRRQILPAEVRAIFKGAPVLPIDEAQPPHSGEAPETQVGATPWMDLVEDSGTVRFLVDGRIFRPAASMGVYVDDKHKIFHTLLPKALEMLGHTRSAMGLFALDSRLTSSGLTILPVRAAEDAPPRLPTVEHLQSGEYPYYTYVALAVRPTPAPELQKFVDYLHEVISRGKFNTDNYWVPELANPRRSHQKLVVWPQTKNSKLPAGLTGAVAVLPFELNNAQFLVAEPVHHAAIEAAVTSAIGQHAQFKLLDRAHIERILAERKLALTAQPRDKPLLAADVLVTSCFVTEDSQTWLVVDAIHGATASLLGEIKFPVTPSKLDAIEKSLTEIVITCG